MSVVSSVPADGGNAALLQEMALRLSRSELCGIDDDVDQAVGVGALVARGNLLCPVSAGRPVRRRHRDPMVGWLAQGLQPVLVKGHSLDPDQQAALALIFAKLREIEYPDALPHWVSARHIFSLYLPDATDLRPVSGTDPILDAAVVHHACVRSLSGLLAVEGELHGALGARELPEFPLLPRYRESQRIFARCFGASAAADLGVIFKGRVSGCRSSFLFDSKPANLIMRQSERTDLTQQSTTRLYRVDLDMMCWTCPLALELALIFLCHPVAFETDGELDLRLDAQLARMCEVARALDAGSEENVLQLSWYHLVRNFCSSIRDQADAKAREMGRLLVSAARHLGLGRETALVRAIDRWVREHDPANSHGGPCVAHVAGF
jgi:hypothetical protein